MMTTRIAAGALITLLLGPVSMASMSPEDYSRAIQIADQHVKRAQTTVTKSRSLFGRKYQVGDSWDVAVIHRPSTEMVRTRGTRSPHAQGGLIGIFRYDVVKAAPDAIQVAVHQRLAQGEKALDPRVEKVLFTFDHELRQTRKEYVFSSVIQAGGAPIDVSPDGLRSPMTRLELLPFDVPPLNSTDALDSKSGALPKLPPALELIAEKSDWASLARSSARLEYSDFFGRPVELLWRSGDPWPSYMKTSLGIAILIRKGDR